ncbi:MAG: hypothetical protein KME64_04135 [Scytonematopsis contorta HA4267-MV1]|jgi:hypothetical protein|nr:hypothetical protein [Scytonematopsis contorta HA4267-MV1]
MYKWASIVYSRTYEVDFRFITVPKGFTSEDKDWLWNHIRTTTRSAEKLLGNPRWSLFMGGHYCVIGVTCMASDLIGATEDTKSEDITRDFQGRPLYLFVGYVAEFDKRKRLPPIPQYAGKDIQLFKPLYSYISDQWFVKSYQPASRVSIESEYRELVYSQLEDFPSLDTHLFTLNIDDQVVTLWADTEANRNNLWIAASRSITSHCNPTSLCLGLEVQRDVFDSLFLNATATDIIQKCTLSKAKQSPVNPTPITSETQFESEFSAVEEPTWSQSQSPFPGKSSFTKASILGVLCSLIGAAIAARKAGLIGSIVGGSIIYIVVRWFTKKGSGGGLSRIVGKRFSKLDSQEGDIKEQTHRTSNSGFEQQLNNQNDIYGFRQKSQQRELKKLERSEDEEKSSGWF